MNPNDYYSAALEKENARASHEWAKFPSWNDMTDEQKKEAIALAEKQGDRSLIIQSKFIALGGKYVK